MGRILVGMDDSRSARDALASHVQGWVAPIDAAGTEVEVDVDRDVHPVAALVRALDGHDGSAAIVGSRGISGFTGMRLGRIPIHLLHHSNRPVIVVPQDE